MSRTHLQQLDHRAALMAIDAPLGHRKDRTEPDYEPSDKGVCVKAVERVRAQPGFHVLAENMRR